MKILLKLFIGRLPISLVRYLQEFNFRAYLYLGRHLFMDARDSLGSQIKILNQDSRAIKSFALDDYPDYRLQITDSLTLENIPITWDHSDLTYNKYIGVMLRRNQKITLEQPLIFRNSWLRLSFAPAFRGEGNPHYMLKLRLMGLDGSILPLADFHQYSNSHINAEWSTFLIDLQRLDGETGYLQLSWDLYQFSDAADANSVQDYPVIVSKITVGLWDELELLEARTFHNTRIKNEVGHFTEVYKHKMYESNQYISQPVSILRLKDIPKDQSTEKMTTFRTSQPLENESVYAYACRLLEINLEQKSIDFGHRLLELSRTKSPLRVLSLCSGSARIEAGFDDLTSQTCLWTLQDINDELLQKARDQFAPMASVEFLVGDVNLIHKMDREWDIIMCVSGLHHVVELESVTNFVAQSLSPGGEFWLLGEYVGNSGNRLNSSAQIEADNVFSGLPEKYRFNQHTKRLDSAIPKNDYSIDCFEGIRADQIEKIILRRFATQSISRNNSFLWRLVNLAYADNYDLKKIEDIHVIEKLVRAELLHFNKHHDGTTLNAIYYKI